MAWWWDLRLDISSPKSLSGSSAASSIITVTGGSAAFVLASVENVRPVVLVAHPKQGPERARPIARTLGDMWNWRSSMM